MSPQAPRSTLFPYTTLFRSVEIIELRKNEAEIEIDGRTHFVPFLVIGTKVQFAFDGEIYSIEGELHFRADQDRKSTRLNSSHRCISYAVFCLKKKNKI